jgi:serine/threonine-protein kinase
MLEKYCIRCHGVEFNTPGLDMTSRDSLLQGDTEDDLPFLTPGQKEKSRIYLHTAGLRADKMPPEGELPQPSSEEIELLGRWIDAGARFPEADRPVRAFVGDRAAVDIILADVAEQPEEDRPHVRYFTLTHLWNDVTITDESLQLARAGISKLINSLSSQPTVTPPTPVDEDELILRIDMRNYGWTERTHWLSLLRVYPYGLKYNGTSFDELSSLTASSLPYIRGDWFCFHASRPPLYHDLVMLVDSRQQPPSPHVGLPASQRRLETLLGVDVLQNLSDGDVQRAGLTGNRSGVSDHNRIVERHRSPTGYYWLSYDAAASGGRRNFANFPVGPSDAPNKKPTGGAFEFDGGEIIFSLPNGLQAYMLANAEGARIDVGPTTIVQDRARHSGSVDIVNGISCMGCHRNGMVTFDDSIRALYENRAGTLADQVLKLFPKQNVLDERLSADTAAFANALDAAVGPFLLKNTNANSEDLPEPITFLSKLYGQDLELGDVIRELALPADKEASDAAGIPVASDSLATLIEGSEQLRRLELRPLADGGTVERTQWERNSQAVARELGIAIPVVVN